MSFVRIWLRGRRKAIVALLVAAVGSWMAKHGVGLSADQSAALTALVTAAFVYVVPNDETGI